jgi:hypothetical protein
MRGPCLWNRPRERFEALPEVVHLDVRDETRVGVYPWLP